MHNNVRGDHIYWATSDEDVWTKLEGRKLMPHTNSLKLYLRKLDTFLCELGEQVRAELMCDTRELLPHI